MTDILTEGSQGAIVCDAHSRETRESVTVILNPTLLSVENLLFLVGVAFL